jgi:hypothetical protein
MATYTFTRTRCDTFACTRTIASWSVESGRVGGAILVLVCPNTIGRGDGDLAVLIAIIF